MNATTSSYALCDACGIEQCRHFDGWDGAALGCEETSRRWGGHYVAPAAEADELVERAAVAAPR